VDPLGLAGTGATIGGAIGAVIGGWGGSAIGGILGGLGGAVGGTFALPGGGTIAGGYAGGSAGATALGALGAAAGTWGGAKIGDGIEKMCRTGKEETCAEEIAACTATCTKGRYDPDLRHVFAGSYGACMKNCLSKKCGGA
jgi:hypothetical protein